MPLPDDSVYVLLPLGAQRGKHFAEKFNTEDPNMFWYKDEKQIVSCFFMSTCCKILIIIHTHTHTHTGIIPSSVRLFR